VLATPNLPEAARLLGEPEARTVEDGVRQAKAFSRFGGAATLIKGGHGTDADVVDVLCDNGEIVIYRHPRIETRNTHGTGCTLSAAITARLASGVPLRTRLARPLRFLNGRFDRALGRRLAVVVDRSITWSMCGAL
jgi:hydroxymethylpyrimidine/phosphomethylpyrimidine kinase